MVITIFLLLFLFRFYFHVPIQTFNRWRTRESSARNVHQSTKMAWATCDPKIPNNNFNLFMQCKRRHHLLNERTRLNLVPFEAHAKSFYRCSLVFLFLFVHLFLSSCFISCFADVKTTIKYQSISSNLRRFVRKTNFLELRVSEWIVSTISQFYFRRIQKKRELQEALQIAQSYLP